jgi:hypothetical protein
LRRLGVVPKKSRLRRLLLTKLNGMQGPPRPLPLRPFCKGYKFSTTCCSCTPEAGLKPVTTRKPIHRFKHPHFDGHRPVRTTPRCIWNHPHRPVLSCGSGSRRPPSLAGRGRAFVPSSAGRGRVPHRTVTTASPTPHCAAGRRTSLEPTIRARIALIGSCLCQAGAAWTRPRSFSPISRRGRASSCAILRS